MILIIDTSSPSRSAVATIDGDVTEEFFTPRLDLEFLRRLAAEKEVTKVAVANGPGSFTGLRAGVSFGLGLAIGLGIPIVPLGSLDLQAARSDEPVMAVVEAGRGRYYHRSPGGTTGIAGPAEIPASLPLVGEVADRRALIAAGHRFMPETELRTLAAAAGQLLETATEVPYRNLEIEYMQSFSPRKV